MLTLLRFAVPAGEIRTALEPELKREFEKFIVEKMITHPEVAAAQFTADVRYSSAFAYSHGTFADLVETAKEIIKKALAEGKIRAV